MPLEDSYLGRGWSFPPSFAPPLPLEPLLKDVPPLLQDRADYATGGGGAAMVAGPADIEQSLYILLTTRLGERVLAPDFGCDLQPMAFEPLNAATAAQFQHLIHTAILYHEPRIEFLDLTASQSDDQPGVLLLDLAYQVRSTNARHNYVYPFYLQEGSELGLPTDTTVPPPPELLA